MLAPVGMPGELRQGLLGLEFLRKGCQVAAAEDRAVFAHVLVPHVASAALAHPALHSVL